MLKLLEPNWFNISGTRRVVTHCHPHFMPVSFSRNASELDISNWVYENLEGRYWIGDTQVRSGVELKLDILSTVAFEEHSEATYFSLMLNQINQPSNEWV